MNNPKRRPFRPRQNKSNFRWRSSGSRPHNNSHFQNNNGNNKFGGNGSMTNPFNVEKAVQKYQQLAKDALTSGDPVLHENYLQHAEHFNRRLNELNGKPKVNELNEKPKEQKTEDLSLAEKLNQKPIEKKEVI